MNPSGRNYINENRRTIFITKGTIQSVGDKKRSTVLHKRTKVRQGKFETPTNPIGVA